MTQDKDTQAGQESPPQDGDGGRDAGSTATGGDRDDAAVGGDRDGDDAGTDGTETLESVRAERDKAKRQAARRDTALRAAQAELAQLKGAAKAEDKPKEPDPLERANQRLVRQAARTALAGAGVTDREQQSTVIGFLKLDGVDVGEDGDVDEDAIADLVDGLRRAFGGGQRQRPRVDSRDKGAQVRPVDADTARYRRIMQQGR